MESMPFLHAHRVFNIFFVEDLEFAEVRTILDELLARGAFDPEIQETQGAFRIELGQSSFEVWVSEMDVIIQRQ